MQSDKNSKSGARSALFSWAVFLCGGAVLVIFLVYLGGEVRRSIEESKRSSSVLDCTRVLVYKYWRDCMGGRLDTMDDYHACLSQSARFSSQYEEGTCEQIKSAKALDVARSVRDCEALASLEEFELWRPVYELCLQRFVKTLGDYGRCATLVIWRNDWPFARIAESKKYLEYSCRAAYEKNE